MKIFQVHNSYRHPGGEDISVQAEAALLRNARHDVRQFITANPDRVLPALAAVARAPNNFAMAKKVVEAAQAFGPDVVHIQNTWFAMSPAVVDAVVDAGMPTVLTLHNYRVACIQGLAFRDGEVCTKCVGGRPLPGIRHRCLRNSSALSAVGATTVSLARRRRTWQRPHRLIALSRSAKNVLVAAGLPAEKIEVLPHAVADPGPRRRPPSASSRLLYVGRLTPEKGASLLLETWRKTELPKDLELVVIGDGPMREEIERHLPDRVRLLGWVSQQDVREQMLRARALIFPTQCLEPFGRGVAEAFAAGLPVVGSEIGGTGEILGELGAGWVLPVGDNRRWIKAINRLAEPAVVDAAGARARTIYEQRFAPPVGLARLERLYTSVIDEARG